MGSGWLSWDGPGPDPDCVGLRCLLLTTWVHCSSSSKSSSPSIFLLESLYTPPTGVVACLFPPCPVPPPLFLTILLQCSSLLVYAATFLEYITVLWAPFVKVVKGRWFYFYFYFHFYFSSSSLSSCVVRSLSLSLSPPAREA